VEKAREASLAQLGAGFIQPFAGGTAMAGRAAKGERNGQAQRLSLKRWYETVTISKQLDSDRRAAYVPKLSICPPSRPPRPLFCDIIWPPQAYSLRPLLRPIS